MAVPLIYFLPGLLPPALDAPVRGADLHSAKNRRGEGIKMFFENTASPFNMIDFSQPVYFWPSLPPPQCPRMNHPALG